MLWKMQPAWPVHKVDIISSKMAQQSGGSTINAQASQAIFIYRSASTTMWHLAVLFASIQKIVNM